MSKENLSRLRRARKSRSRIKESGSIRVSVFRTPKHTYAQIFDVSDCINCKCIASVSTLQAGVKKLVKNGGNVDAAKTVGKLLAEKAKTLGISKVSFDRSGYKYHGRVKALADAAREHGLEF